MKETLLITGASGFLGKHLCQRYQQNYNVVAISRNHKNLFEVIKHDQGQTEVYPCDVANATELEKVFIKHKPDGVIHAAATKFVDWAELYPTECVNNNIIGSKNVLDMAVNHGVKKMIAISTDKAAPPVKNLYGMTKAVMEKMYTLSSSKDTKIACVRYGNVLWSTGSVLPVWSSMAESGKPILTTGPNMTRFFFTVADAVDLIDFALQNIEVTQGKIVSQKMKSCKISSLLKAFCEVNSCQSQEADLRPGERNYEVLIGQSESDFTEDLDGKYLLLHLNSKKPLVNKLDNEYTTENADFYSHDELLKLVVPNV